MKDNFKYQRRCVIVEVEDVLTGNIPKLKDKFIYKYDENYPSNELKDDNKFKSISIVMTSGYYEGACIDIIDKPDFLSDEYALYGYFDEDQFLQMNEIAGDIYKDFKHYGVKLPTIKKLLDPLVSWEGKLGTVNPYIAPLENYLRNLELKKANKVVDNIKKNYGYIELGK